MKKRPSLLFCVVMDLLGYATYVLPFFGEFADIIWAPVSGLIFYATWGGKKGALGGLFNFAEEILPVSDFIPTFTLTWAFDWFAQRQQKVRVLPQ